MISHPFTHRAATLLCTLLSASAWSSVSCAAVSFTGTPYSQDFDSLEASGTAWTNDSTLQGWSLFKQPAPGTAFTSILVGTGSSNTGNFYSFGNTPERALGGVGSGNATVWNGASSGAVAGWIAAAFTNGTTAAIESFTVEYDGEQWRDGNNAAAQTTVMEYGYGASFGDVGTWTPAGTSFDFVSPKHTTTAGALDGNAGENRAAGLGGLISSTWNVGDTLWLRWIEVNDTGNDHGLALDNFMLSLAAPPMGLAGDYNDDDVVDAADYVMWRKAMTVQTSLLNETKSLGTVDAEDYTEWAANFGEMATGSGNVVALGAASVPEPASAVVLLGLAALSSLLLRVRPTT